MHRLTEGKAKSNHPRDKRGAVPNCPDPPPPPIPKPVDPCELCGGPIPEDGLYRHYRVRARDVGPLCPGCTREIDGVLDREIERLTRNRALNRRTLEESHRLLGMLLTAIHSAYSFGVSSGTPPSLIMKYVNDHLAMCKRKLVAADSSSL